LSPELCLEFQTQKSKIKNRRFPMSQRKIEVFSAGCPCCTAAVELVKRLACPACEVKVLDMHAPAVAERARELGIRSVPAVAVDGRLAGCCSGRGPDEESLRAAGLGRPLP
jgi:glutaredoxin 3